MAPNRGIALLGCLTFCLVATEAIADTLELADGARIEGCYVRDEGSRLRVWRSLDEVGGPDEVYPRAMVKGFTVDRGPEWDAHPALPDLSVTFIEITPKLAGLHGNVDYDETNAPTLRMDIPAMRDIGQERAYAHPEEIARALKLRYTPGEIVTFTAHVRNVGFAPAPPFGFECLFDDKVIAQGRCNAPLAEMEEMAFDATWPWEDGEHTVTVRVIPAGEEIASTNDSATDALWAMPFVFVVQPSLVDAWHQNRTAYGTFSFEDFYRWHVDIMNTLFAESRYPSSPDGIRARVRLDRIAYVTDRTDPAYERPAADGVLYNQGMWDWCRDEPADKVWEPPTHEWRNQTEWSLPHELGHQLGLVDWYAIDCDGADYHAWPDSAKRVTHFQRHPMQMMHWHGPHLYGEVDAAYLNHTWDKPRGYFGDHYFAIPDECFVRVVDVNGEPVPDAEIEVFQRGVKVDPNGQPAEDHGATYYPVTEDGDFYTPPISELPVIVGRTDANGVLRLPNRPVREVTTLNGFHRKPNPFGNINVVGNRGLFLLKVTKGDRPCYYWLEGYQFNVAWFRGERESCTMTLATPYAGPGAPIAPRAVSVERLEGDQARVTWEPGAPGSLNYLDRAVGFRVYRRISDDGLNDRPWFEVATVGAAATDATVDLSAFPEDTYWFSKTNRFAVSAIGECGMQSELVEVLLPE